MATGYRTHDHKGIPNPLAQLSDEELEQIGKRIGGEKVPEAVSAFKNACGSVMAASKTRQRTCAVMKAATCGR